MKLLMTCDAVGGVWQYATELVRALTDAGVEVVLAVLGPAGAAMGPVDPRAHLVHTDLPLDWLATGPSEVLAAGRAIAGLAAEHRADLVHLNAPALAAAGRFPVPVVAVAHGCVGTWWAAAYGGAPDPALAWHGELMRAGLLAADAVVAPSAAFAATLRCSYALPAMPRVVHNGRTPLPLPDALPADHVFTAGRLWDRVKNTDLLDRVAALLPVALRAAGPVVAPQGEAVAPVHLDLLGPLSEAALAAELARGPIFVSAAAFEPFGLAVLEAAQAGCPLILSGIDTFRELWTGAALFVTDATPEGYAAAIARVRANPDLRRELSDAARVRAMRFTPGATAAAMLDVYRLLRAAERVAA